ncbi:ABC transporter substrate-binding protein [Oryzomicrobium sp.]|uniref:ABC transporter substrate-binding protein n=1 Tax=Oryzomicrobium sp. TaxID=1911578 RepID=UPI0025F30B88|nr:ABC transporter substrate-binding protein [Oryzomicrobium sp.]
MAFPFFRSGRAAAMAGGRLCRCLLMLLGLALLAGCDKPRLPLAVGANPWPGYEALFLARDQGLVSEAAVRVLDFPATGEVMRAFRNGTLDAAALTLDEALTLVGNGEAVKVVLVFDVSAGGDAVVAQPGLESLGALRGRRIGLEPNTTASLLLYRALNSAGLAAGDVTVVPLSLDKQQRALQRGEVDALATCEPVRSRLAAGGARVLYDSTAMPNEIVDVLVVRQAALDERPGDVAALVHGLGRAQQRLIGGDATVIAQGAHRSNLTPDQFRQALAGMILPDIEQNRRLLAPRGELDVQAGRLVAFMEQQGWLRQAPAASVLDDRLVRDAAILPQGGGRS